jgi:pilus assembly protein CpaE
MKSQTNLPPERIPRAALISPDPSFRTVITSCLDQTVSSVEWVLRAESEVSELRPESVDRLAEREPDLLFLDVGSSASAGVRFVAAITRRLPGLTVIAAGGPLGVDELLELIRAGASGYLRSPWSRDEVTDVCSNALRKMPPRQAEVGGPEQTHASTVIALFAPKGGTGVSTLAANLAVHIRRATAKKTLLMDLSPELGTCSVLMGMEPRYSYLDVLESLERMDERLLYSFLEEHDSGTRVLASPAGASMARELPAKSMVSLQRLMRRHFEYVVVDVGRGIIDDASAKTLELADERLVVTTAELPTLRNVKQVLSYLPHGGDPSEAVRLVVNRYEEGVSLPAKDVERAVGLPLFQILYEDRERMGRSVNLGRPLVLNGSSPYARAVGEMGDRLAADDVLAKRSKSSLGGLLRTLLPPFGRANGSEERPAERHAAGSGRDAAANGRRPAVSGRHQPSNGRHPPANGRPERAESAPSTSRRTQMDAVR